MSSVHYLSCLCSVNLMLHLYLFAVVYVLYTLFEKAYVMTVEISNFYFILFHI